MPLRSWPDPSSGVDIFYPEHGENVSDDLTLMAKNWAKRGWAHMQCLRNYEFDQGTLRRRKPFTAKSTVDWTSAGVFQGGHDYVDGTDTARLLHAHNNGSIKEFTAAGASADRVTGLTTGRKVRFEDFNGACFAVNGADQPRRGDAATWRLAGAPAALAAPTAGASGAGNIEAGQYIYMVTACIRSGGVVILESDHSAYLTLTYGSASQQVINWSASGDGRVNWYRLYRTKRGLGLPFFLHTEGNVTTATDNSADASLSATEAAPLARNGTMPIAAIVARSGQRLALANLSTDSKGVALSIIAADNYQMEYIPTDGIHRFRLPGRGPVTACYPIGTKDEEDNANDLFLAQADSCYILRQTDPKNTVETISAQRGCIGPDAVAQWGRYLFFVSREGLEFLGPSGAPVMISRFVNAYLKGGGPQALNGLQGESYVHLKVWQNKLLIAFRDDSSKSWGNKTLVLDLEIFNPFEPLNVKTTRFTHWTGPGMAFYVVGSTGGLYLFDNQNYRLLERATTGANDVIAGVNTTIRCEPWTGAMVGELLTFRKQFCSVNIFQVSDVNTVWTFEIDYSLIDDTPRTIPQNATERDWNKAWNKAWESAPRYKGCIGLRRGRRRAGAFIVAKGVIDNSGTDHYFLGVNLNYTMVKQRTVCKR